MWAGRFQKNTDKAVNDYNSSLPFDSRMFAEDIQGSLAHSRMLGKQGILSKEDTDAIEKGLLSIKEDIIQGKLTFDSDAEDIHMFIEEELTARIGDAGKRLHTGRSRNDQVALDQRLYLIDEAVEVRELMLSLYHTILTKAKENTTTYMPGYTHLQRAQPITFAHHMCAYLSMIQRDITRLDDCVMRTKVSPLGSGALAGTTYPLDREFVASELSFS
ncbi:MAG TPA: argininosuccinate lyase, partial [Bacillota bacterium]|nr:argininosuccinate lyase [Bacillota bacterium]